MGVLSFFDKSDKTKITIVKTKENYEIPLLERESHNWTTEVTQFPVESGGTASDHAQRNQDEYTISGIVSDSPLDFFDIATGAWFKNPTMDAVAFFRGLIDLNSVVDIDTRFFVYENMVCTSVTVDRASDQGKALTFSATFKEVQFVDSSSVVMESLAKFAKDATGKVASKGAGAATKEVGKKAATPASTAAKGNGSSLAKLAKLKGA
jgi:hypothetical protein